MKEISDFPLSNLTSRPSSFISWQIFCLESKKVGGGETDFYPSRKCMAGQKLRELALKNESIGYHVPHTYCTYQYHIFLIQSDLFIP